MKKQKTIKLFILFLFALGLLLSKVFNPAVNAQELKADFDINIISETPLEVEFINESKGNYEKIIWNFGDGNISYEENPIHTFQEGRYDVTLTVIESSGKFDQDLRTDFIATKDFEQDIDFSEPFFEKVYIQFSYNLFLRSNYTIENITIECLGAGDHIVYSKHFDYLFKGQVILLDFATQNFQKVKAYHNKKEYIYEVD